MGILILNKTVKNSEIMESSTFISRKKRLDLFVHTSFGKISEDENQSKGGLNQSGDETFICSTRNSWMSKLSIDGKECVDSMYDSFLSPQASKPRVFSKFKTLNVYGTEELNTIGEVLEQEERLHMAHLLAKNEKELP